MALDPLVRTVRTGLLTAALIAAWLAVGLAGSDRAGVWPGSCAGSCVSVDAFAANAPDAEVRPGRGATELRCALQPGGLVSTDGARVRVHPRGVALAPATTSQVARRLDDRAPGRVRPCRVTSGGRDLHLRHGVIQI